MVGFAHTVTIIWPTSLRPSWKNTRVGLLTLIKRGQWRGGTWQVCSVSPSGSTKRRCWRWSRSRGRSTNQHTPLWREPGRGCAMQSYCCKPACYWASCWSTDCCSSRCGRRGISTWRCPRRKTSPPMCSFRLTMTSGWEVTTWGATRLSRSRGTNTYLLSTTMPTSSTTHTGRLGSSTSGSWNRCQRTNGSTITFVGAGRVHNLHCLCITFIASVNAENPHSNSIACLCTAEICLGGFNCLNCLLIHSIQSVKCTQAASVSSTAWLYTVHTVTDRYAVDPKKHIN